ncbi:MAG: aspartate aminotransferase family protein [Pseudomonadota bacterium]
MSKALHRTLLSTPVKAVRGDGCFIVDESGNRYLDGCGGAAVSCLGHSHPAVIEAVQKQVAQLPYAHTAFFTTAILEELAETLVGNAPGMGKVMLLAGGSEAVEAALKLARQYHLEAGQPERTLFIARRQSYHGNTLGALSVGGNEWRREPFRPLLMPGNHIAPCFEYRDRNDEESAADYGQRVANELEAKILELGASNVAAFVAETVVGATAGAVAPVPGYFERVREICDQHGVLLILDEIMCGTGRTGTMMAYEQDGVTPDIVTMAKGLAAGYQPIGAMLCRDEITNAIRDGSGFFQHGHTFMGHATAVAAALATLKTIRDDDLLANVAARGQQLKRQLQDALGEHPNVGDVRGRGLFIGVEFVADRITKEPLDPAAKAHGAVQSAAMQRGLMCYGMGGTIDGRRGNHVLIAPPYIIDEACTGELVEMFSGAVLEAMPVP